MEEKMKKRIQVVVSGLMFVCLFWMFTGCAGKEFVRRDIRSDVKTEQVIQNDPFADMRATPDNTQQDQKDQIKVTIEYLRLMKESDFKCIGLGYDPLSPKILMAFSMLNTSERVREYTPFFVFKGQKNLDLSEKDPCRFFTSYGGVTHILAKEGNRFSLNCGEGGGARNTDSVSTGGGRTVTLYPEVPVYGILIVGTEGNITDLRPGVKLTSKINGHAAFFETPSQGMTPANFRFNYSFERKDWLEEMIYDKSTPFNYAVNIYNKFTDTILLGRINDGSEEQKVSDSEQYGEPRYTRVGPAKKK